MICALRRRIQPCIPPCADSIASRWRSADSFLPSAIMPGRGSCRACWLDFPCRPCLFDRERFSITQDWRRLLSEARAVPPHLLGTMLTERTELLLSPHAVDENQVRGLPICLAGRFGTRNLRSPTAFCFQGLGDFPCIADKVVARERKLEPKPPLLSVQSAAQR